MEENTKQPKMIWRWVTYYDFRTQYTEEEVREMLEKGFCCPEQIEEEIDIIFHRPDTDFSLNILSYTQQKYIEQTIKLINDYEKKKCLSDNQDNDK